MKMALRLHHQKSMRSEWFLQKQKGIYARLWEKGGAQVKRRQADFEGDL